MHMHSDEYTLKIVQNVWVCEMQDVKFESVRDNDYVLRHIHHL